MQNSSVLCWFFAIFIFVFLTFCFDVYFLNLCSQIHWCFYFNACLLFILHATFLWFCIYSCKSFQIITAGHLQNTLTKKIHFSLHLQQWWMLEGIVRRMEALVFDPVPVTPHPRPLTSMRLCELLSQFLVLLHFTHSPAFYS